MEIVNIAVKTTLDQLLDLHKNASSDVEFMDSGFEIIQTLLNNVHMAQSHMFASLISNVIKQHSVIEPMVQMKSNTHTAGCKNILLPFSHVKREQKEEMHPYTTHISKVCPDIDSSTQCNAADMSSIDKYMSQFSNISISAKNEVSCSQNVNPPLRAMGEGSINKWLREQRQAAIRDFSNLKKPQYLAQSSTMSDKYNIFDDDEPGRPLMNYRVADYNPDAWHDKINIDVEQCCARIGRQTFMIDHMEPEFLDNYPSDTYIDENGFVHGRSCLRTIDTNLFNSGQIFCNDHAYGYEDIRKQPLTPACVSPDIDFM